MVVLPNRNHTVCQSAPNRLSLLAHQCCPRSSLATARQVLSQKVRQSAPLTGRLDWGLVCHVASLKSLKGRRQLKQLQSLRQQFRQRLWLANLGLKARGEQKEPCPFCSVGIESFRLPVPVQTPACRNTSGICIQSGFGLHQLFSRQGRSYFCQLLCVIHINWRPKSSKSQVCGLRIFDEKDRAHAATQFDW